MFPCHGNVRAHSVRAWVVLTRFAQPIHSFNPGLRRMSRPRKDPLQLRTTFVTLRFTPAEHQKLCLLARLHNLPVGRYLREAGLDRPLPAPVPTIHQAAYRELCRIGSNLNQLTRLAHEGKAYPGVLSILRGLNELVASVKASLRPSRPR